MLSRLRIRVGLLAALYRRLRLRLAVYVVLTFAATVIEGLALSAIVPLIQGVDGDISGPFGIVTRAIGFEPADETDLVLVVGALFVLRGVLQYLSQILAGLMFRRHMVATQVELFEAYLEVRPEVAAGISQGEVNLLLSQQVNQSAQFLRQLLSLAEATIYALVLTAVAVAISPDTTGAAIALIGASVLVVGYLSTLIRKLATQVLGEAKQLAGLVLQYARGATDLRSYRVTAAAVSSVEATALRRERLQFQAERLRVVSVVLPDILFVVALLAVVAIGFETGGDFAEIGAVVALLFRISQYLKRFSNMAALSNAIPAVADVVRHQRLFRAERQADDLLEVDPGRPEGSVALAGVTYTHTDAHEPAVRGLDITVEAGSFVGLVGSSGSGKSTLVSLLVGLRRPDTGTVVIGGDPATRPAQRIAFVQQTPFVLKGSIASNVAWFRDVDDEAVTDACVAAGLQPLLDRLDDGIHTPVGQEGNTLSGGERQRLALARALVGNPSILVLDEATSALDSESEAAIQRALHAMRGSVTIVAVAHRLSTVVDADRIIVLEDGRIAEDATPAELLADAGSRFAQLGALQGLTSGSNADRPGAS